MGCDIHQFFVLPKKKSKDVVIKSFLEYPFYEKDLIKLEHEVMNNEKNFKFFELFSGRCYDFFGIIAGVRSDYFTITSNKKHSEWPFEVVNNNDIEFKNEIDYTFSPVWYYLPELKNELIKTINKIKKFSEKMSEFDKNYEEDDFCKVHDLEMIELLKNVISNIKKLEDMKKIYNDYNFSKMKIIFSFDN